MTALKSRETDSTPLDGLVRLDWRIDMSNEYWEAVMDEMCDQHSLNMSTKESVAMAKDLCSAADVAGEMTGHPSYMIDPVKEANPFKERCIILQEALDRMGHRYGVSVDPDKMEISYMESISSSHMASTSKPI